MYSPSNYKLENSYHPKPILSCIPLSHRDNSFFFSFLETIEPDEQSAGEPSTKKPRSQLSPIDSVVTSCELKEINESKLVETRFSLRYTCDQCDYATKKSDNLKVHKESNHEGIRYPCDQCDYVATTSNSLKRHKESKHEGIRYPCDQCDYAATRTGDLKRHKKSKHEGF